jgi:hypothetical protein
MACSVSTTYFPATAHDRLDRLERVVTHVGALDDVDDLLGEVLRMIADAFDRLGDEHEVDRRRDRARVLHHVGDQLAHQTVELAVDLVVLLDDFERSFGVEACEGIQRLAQRRGGEAGLERDVADRQAHAAEHAAVDQSLHRARDARRLVADALEVADRLADGDQQAEVARRRLPPRDDRRQVAIDLQFHAVHPLFLSDHLRRGLAAEMGQGVDRLCDLRLGEPAHLEHAGGDVAQLGVELR